MSTPMPLRRLGIYCLAFILPPIMLGLVTMFSTFSSVMIRKEPRALSTSTKIPDAPSLRTSKPKKLKALILMSNAGTEVTDLLSPHEILAQSGRFDVFTIAPERKLSSTTGDLAIIPDLAFADWDLKRNPVDLLVIPAVLDPTNPTLVNWIRDAAASARFVLSVCEGARLAAEAGILKGRKATSHFLALKSLRTTAPETEWVHGARVVSDGNIISAAGVTAALDGTLEAIAQLAGRTVADQTATQLSYRQETYTSSPLTLSDALQMFLHGGYGWNKPSIAVLIYPGISEIGLAAALETFPRTLNTRVATVAPERTIIRSRHGLTLVPSRNVLDLSTDFFSTDYLIVPSGAGQENMKLDPAIERWVNERKISVKNMLRNAPGKAFEQNLELIAQIENSNRLTQFVAKMIEYPYLHQTQGFELGLLPRPFFVGLIGLVLAWLVFYNLRLRGTYGHKKSK